MILVEVSFDCGFLTVTKLAGRVQTPARSAYLNRLPPSFILSLHHITHPLSLEDQPSYDSILQSYILAHSYPSITA